MQIAYFDESGDDGYPSYSSPIFVLTAVYLHYLNWQPIFNTLLDFRRQIKASFSFPVRWEMHTRHFIHNKNPFRALGLGDKNRLDVIDLFCDLIGSLEIKIINIVIVKSRVNNPNYRVLDTALKYSVQRIENDLNPAQNPQSKFLIITDPGRVGKMRKTTRRIRRINFIPSKYSPTSYRREIRTLVEDPLQKDSKESYFIQLADTVSYVVYLHSNAFTGSGGIPNRLRPFLNQAKVTDWMDRMKPSLNLLASSKDPYGIVYHP